MSDVLNIINEIDNLKSEIQSLKSESKYLRKKSEITPLIALFNHIRSYSLIGKNIVYTVTFYTNDKERYSYRDSKIIALDDAIHEIDGKVLKKVCYIKDIIKVELVSNYEDKRQTFTYKFKK